MIALQLLPKLTIPEPPDSVQDRAMWNPLVGGMFLSYVTFFANLEGGAAMIDSFAQLRFVLHLFNAFKQLKIVKEGLVPLLDVLDEYFEDSEAVWEGSKPRPGDFVFRWWIAYGMKADVAHKLVEETKKLVHTGDLLCQPSTDVLRIRDEDVTCQLTPIRAEDFSKSYRRICMRDFKDVVDRYHNERQRREGKGSALYEHAVRINDTMDAMSDDHKLLASNLISVGGILNEFTYKLFQEMGWKTEVDYIVKSTPEEIKTIRRPDGRRVKPGSWEASDENFERFVMVLLFSQRLLGAMDFSYHGSSPSLQILKAAEFFGHFFGTSLDPELFLFFAPAEADREGLPGF